MMVGADLDERTLDALLPTGPIHSLRQVQAVYGAIAEATAETTTPPGQEEYSLYFTPSELDSFVATGDDERLLVSVKVDLTEDDPAFVGVDVRPLDRDLVSRLGFARYPWGRGIDHSITRRGAAGGSDASTVTTYCEECLVRWTNGDDREPAVGEIADDHPDGWIIHWLAELGQGDEVLEQIERDVNAQISGDPRVVATVQLKLDPDTLEEPPATSEPEGFGYYPGELPVFNEAMKARKTWKLVAKNIDRGTSEGEAACMVTSDEGRVVGTAEDPFALFTLQHTEKFDDLAREESWREHSISPDSALLLDAGTGFLNACREIRNGLRVYSLPYFTEMDTIRARLLHHALSNLQEWTGGEKHPMVFLQETIENEGEQLNADVDDLRFYVVSVRNDQGDIFVFNEKPDATIFPARELAQRHLEVLESSSFGPIGFERPDDWRHLHKGISHSELVSAIVSGSYARDTVSLTDGDEGAMANDPSEHLAFATLAGEPVDRNWLLDQYVTRLAQERDRDEEGRLSTNHLITQLAQLDALSAAGLLKGSDRSVDPISMTQDDTSTDDVLDPMSELPDIEELTDEGVPRIDELREYRLRTFLDERPDLREIEERLGAFLIGVLLGQLSTHQGSNRNMNRTFANQYQAESLTLHQLDELVTRLLDKDRVYAGEYDFSRDGSCFPETTERLTEVLAGNRPSDWTDLPLSDARFHLALGVTYGLQAQSQAFELRDKIEHALDTPTAH